MKLCHQRVIPALHWAGKVSDEERAEILAWIAKQRAEYYASNDTAPEHRNEPVQPIPQKLPTDAQKSGVGFCAVSRSPFIG
ncbi:putative cytochrome C peroxidase [Escherichia coli]|uniref:Putative cytochrome C peroxidase n=1 Tax=Escherichia coli TaxID=562 RepID=A0A377AKB9_ECOLX|nr:putative cytochrome C peroxidase [Escherichia coli]